MTLVTRTRAEPAGSYIRVVGGEVVEEGRRPAAPGTGGDRPQPLCPPARPPPLPAGPPGRGRRGGAGGRPVCPGYPEIEFKFASEGRVRLRTAGDGQLRSAAAEVWGDGVARQLIEVGRVVEAGWP